MEKQSFRPGAMLNPVPVVMVSCGTKQEPNIITIAWTGIVNSDPPMTYISVRKQRHSYSIIKESGEFVINLCTENLAFAADYCGVKSGRDADKFAAQNLTPVPGEEVSCPAIKESPVNLECKVKEIHSYGSHDMFVAEIVNVRAHKALIDAQGRIRLDQAGLICYNHGEYFGLKKEALGRFGYSVMKPKTRKRIAAEKRKKAAGAKRRAAEKRPKSR
ncbi:MAG: flavin reductase family protein [Firmicutes bacterium]|nr:flavin reductase family protein [Bacillota bacterium]